MDDILVKYAYPAVANYIELPKRETIGSAGFDLRYANPTQVVIEPGKRAVLETGLVWKIPFGYMGLVCSRSGLAAKQGLFVLNAPGIVDSDYRGEVKVILANMGDQPAIIKVGDRIAQMIVSPYYSARQMAVIVVDKLDETTRGDGGFGSTGIS